MFVLNKIMLIILVCIGANIVVFPPVRNETQGVFIKGVEAKNIFISTLPSSSYDVSKFVPHNTSYILYPEELIKKQISLLPKPIYFSSIPEYSQCQETAEFYKVVLRQTMPGVCVIKLFGWRGIYNEDGLLINQMTHAWVSILTQEHTLIEINPLLGCEFYNNIEM